MFFRIFIEMKNLIIESEYEPLKTFEKGNKGCKLISDGKYREWCEKAEIMLSAYTTGYLNGVKKEVEGFKLFIENNNFEKYKKYIKEFNEKDSFFKENLVNVNILKEKLNNCEKASEKIDEFINTKIKSKFLLVYHDTNEMVYDIINKFNTNYTAIAYLLTKIIELRTGDESTKFNEVFNKYFIEKSEKGESEFYKDLLNYLERTGPNLNEKFDGVILTIKETSRVGLKTENDFIKVLDKHNRTYYSFAGDFSFNDLMGVDLLLQLKDEEWVPVQVKTSKKHCGGNFRFCKNMCVARNGQDKWIGYVYDGDTQISVLNF